MKFLVLFFYSLYYITLISGESKYSILPVCLPYQACRGQVKIFHVLNNSIETTTFKNDIIEGSGEGSGEAFPFYDEFVEPLTKFNFDGSAEVNDTPICRCSDNQDETDEDYEESCNYDDPSKVMNIEKTVQLSFCKPIKELFPSECFGRRNVLRVIGTVHESGEALESIVDSVIFCHCKSETFTRIAIEPWPGLGGYSFTYKCL
uniref:DUF4773 domain-containing protein n=1 Tax=Parastrongyloides trichosuri TaxID=131310 RepID=A0A0N4ZN58_PARTI